VLGRCEDEEAGEGEGVWRVYADREEDLPNNEVRLVRFDAAANILGGARTRGSESDEKGGSGPTRRCCVSGDYKMRNASKSKRERERCVDKVDSGCG
jgi:hypothetical protein